MAIRRIVLQELDALFQDLVAAIERCIRGTCERKKAKDKNRELYLQVP
jgi:hypothetical protein